MSLPSLVNIESIQHKRNCTIRVKHKREKGLNNCISLSQWPWADSQLGLLKSTNGNGILTQPSSRKQFACRRKRSMKKGREVVIFIYNYTIDLFTWSPIYIFLNWSKNERRANSNFSDPPCLKQIKSIRIGIQTLGKINRGWIHLSS